MHINAHCHLFTNHHLPDRILPASFLVNFLRDGENRGKIARFLHNIIPFSSKDLFDRIDRYFVSGAHAKQQGVLDDLLTGGKYDSDWRFCVLAMDFEFMGAGRTYPGATYRDQLEGLARLTKRSDGRIIPFVCADPRRPHLLDLVVDAVERLGFKGIKIYPPMGYFPDDERLLPIYQYALARDLPVIAHASPSSPLSHGRDRRAMTTALRTIHPDWPRLPFTTLDRSSLFAHPEGFRRLLEIEGMRDLRLCLAHFGGVAAWKQLVKSGMHPTVSVYDSSDAIPFVANWAQAITSLLSSNRYLNLHADVAGTFEDHAFVPLLSDLLDHPVVGSRIHFGTDFYMNEIETSEAWFTKGLRKALGEERWHRLSSENARGFLKI